MFSCVFRLSLLCILLAGGYGCATIVHGTTQKIPISSDPSGASLTVAGQTTKHITPCEVELSRKADHILKIEKDGCEPSTVEIRHVVSGAVAGNILAGGLIGWGVDASSGGQYRLVPETVNVTLKSSQPPPLVPSAATALEPPKTKDLISELAELDQMKEDKKITSQEYKVLRKKIIEKY